VGVIRPPTNQRMATALGMSAVNLGRLKGRGLPLPDAGEDLATWAKRVQP